MKIAEIIRERRSEGLNVRPVTIAFIGDSVTHGVFELRRVMPEGFECVYDPEHVYHNVVRKILSELYPGTIFNIINAGLNGTDAPTGLARLERDVLSCRPELTVVCFGLNDSGRGEEGIPIYLDALRSMFTRLRENGSEVIFMTPNLMADSVKPTITDDFMRKLTTGMVESDMNGRLEIYMDAARRLCAEMDVRVCDCHALWKQMKAVGIDTTGLLVNDINHPSRFMHKMFAYELVKTMLS